MVDFPLQYLSYMTHNIAVDNRFFRNQFFRLILPSNQVSYSAVQTEHAIIITDSAVVPIYPDQLRKKSLNIPAKVPNTGTDYIML